MPHASKTLFCSPITLLRTQNQPTKEMLWAFAYVITSHWKSSPKFLLAEITAYQILLLLIHSQELLLRRNCASGTASPCTCPSLWLLWVVLTHETWMNMMSASSSFGAFEAAPLLHSPAFVDLLRVALQAWMLLVNSGRPTGWKALCPCITSWRNVTHSQDPLFSSSVEEDLSSLYQKALGFGNLSMSICYHFN